MKPHLRLHFTKREGTWWISAHYPWDTGYTVASTMNCMDPLQACVRARAICFRMKEHIRRHERPVIDFNAMTEFV